jgi:hypothetical protein
MTPRRHWKSLSVNCPVAVLDEQLSSSGAIGAAAGMTGVVVGSAAHKGASLRHSAQRGSGVPLDLAAILGVA